jgi:hypothetical protein
VAANDPEYQCGYLGVRPARCFFWKVICSLAVCILFLFFSFVIYARKY